MAIEFMCDVELDCQGPHSPLVDSPLLSAISAFTDGHNETDPFASGRGSRC